MIERFLMSLVWAVFQQAYQTHQNQKLLLCYPTHRPSHHLLFLLILYPLYQG
uniref:Uncharacterized protein n=1 Tax=uncultured marine virus TaxID=186617 RepID=A0A0F7L486_9VIRU|nr:hypothetical protein [uncultured marine virus]